MVKHVNGVKIVITYTRTTVYVLARKVSSPQTEDANVAATTAKNATTLKNVNYVMNHISSPKASAINHHVPQVSTKVTYMNAVSALINV